MQTTGVHTRKHLGTIQVVSFLVFGVFQVRKTSEMHFVHPCAPFDVISVKMMPSSGEAHPHLHPVQV